MIKYLIQALPAPVNVFTGGWYILQDSKLNIPTQGVGQSSRLDDRYMITGIDYVLRAYLSNLGAGLPVQIRVLLGFYR